MKPSAIDHSAANQTIVTAGSAAPMAWFAVALFCLLYLVSFVDRLIIALIANPLGRDLGVSDTALGLLFGFGFAVLYVLIGIPIADLLDRRTRKTIVLAGVCLWSLCTIASAVAWDYPSLFILRAGVAIGEAVLSPAAISFIGDLFPKEKRPLATTIYMATGVLAGTGAFLLGGAALAWAQHLQPVVGMSTWRLTLIIVGVPGLILAAIFALAVKEPERGIESSNQEKNATMREAFNILRAEWRIYLPIFTAVGVMSMVSMGVVAWAPTMLSRAFGIPPSHGGMLFGTMGVIAGVTGTLVVPATVMLLIRRGMANGLVATMVCCVLIVLAATAVCLQAQSAYAWLVCFAPGLAALAGLTTLPPVVISMLAPGPIRARLMALNLLFLGIVGQGLGPLITAFAAKESSNPNALSYGLLVTTAIAVPLALIALAIGHAALADRLKQEHQRTSGSTLVRGDGLLRPN